MKSILLWGVFSLYEKIIYINFIRKNNLHNFTSSEWKKKNLIASLWFLVVMIKMLIHLSYAISEWNSHYEWSPSDSWKKTYLFLSVTYSYHSFLFINHKWRCNLSSYKNMMKESIINGKFNMQILRTETQRRDKRKTLLWSFSRGSVTHESQNPSTQLLF